MIFCMNEMVCLFIINDLIQVKLFLNTVDVEFLTKDIFHFENISQMTFFKDNFNRIYQPKNSMDRAIS